MQIWVDYSLARDSLLERELKERFSLKEVRVLRSFGRSEDEVISGMGQLAASYLDEVIRDGMIVGVSYGRSVASAVQRVKPKSLADIVVLQVIGALGSGNPLQDGPDLARQLANLYGGAYRYLHAPLMVESARTRELLSHEPLVKDLLQTARQADVILMGVSPLTPDTAGLIFTDYLNKTDLERLSASGAVGHMCAQFFDADGNLTHTPFNERGDHGWARNAARRARGRDRRGLLGESARYFRCAARRVYRRASHGRCGGESNISAGDVGGQET